MECHGFVHVFRCIRLIPHIGGQDVRADLPSRFDPVSTGSEDRLMLTTLPEDHAGDLPGQLHVARPEMEEQPDVYRHDGQHLFKRRDPLACKPRPRATAHVDSLQLGQRPFLRAFFLPRQPLQCEIMREEQPPIARPADVEFDHVDAEADGLPECGQRALRMGSHPPAMCANSFFG